MPQRKCEMPYRLRSFKYGNFIRHFPKHSKKLFWWVCRLVTGLQDPDMYFNIEGLSEEKLDFYLFYCPSGYNQVPPLELSYQIGRRRRLKDCGAVRRERSYIHRAPPLLRSVTKCPCMWPVGPVETFQEECCILYRVIQVIALFKCLRGTSSTSTMYKARVTAKHCTVMDEF